MFSIDEIMNMLDANNSIEIQSKGIELAKNIRCINVFIMPMHKGNEKNVWDNCAKILSQKSDEELKPYLRNLLEWLKDLNWPGALCLLERIKHYEDKYWLNYCINDCLREASLLGNISWKENLNLIK